MTVRYDSEFLKKLKHLDVRIRKSFKMSITIFARDPHDAHLNNHPLHREYTGIRSIDVTNNYRALYREKSEGNEIVAYFEEIGTHEELYGQKKD